MTTSADLEVLFDQAVKHREEHHCSAPPYENYQRLFQSVTNLQPQTILEIGTGMGFSAVVMALAAPHAIIDTLEKDPEHISYAKEFINTNLPQNNINLINASAEDYLITLEDKKYDFIFFDGFQIHYQFLPLYERLLKPGGILFLANNHLQSRTSDQFFEELNYQANWNILEQFADTTIAKRI